MFCYVLLCVHFRIAIFLKGKRKLVALLLLSYRCVVTINDMWLFLAVPWAGLQCVIVVFLLFFYFMNDVCSEYDRSNECETVFSNKIDHQIRVLPVLPFERVLSHIPHTNPWEG